jgi:hypothetical protein
MQPDRGTRYDAGFSFEGIEIQDDELRCTVKERLQLASCAMVMD